MVKEKRKHKADKRLEVISRIYAVIRILKGRGYDVPALPNSGLVQMSTLTRVYNQLVDAIQAGEIPAEEAYPYDCPVPHQILKLYVRDNYYSDEVYGRLYKQLGYDYTTTNSATYYVLWTAHKEVALRYKILTGHDPVDLITWRMPLEHPVPMNPQYLTDLKKINFTKEGAIDEWLATFPFSPDSIARSGRLRKNS